MNLIRRTILAVKPQPPVLNPEQIEKASFLRSIFWDGENGAGLPGEFSEAEFEMYLTNITKEH